MLLRIPDSHKEHVKALAELGSEERDRLLGALRAAGPSVMPGTLGRSVAKATNIPTNLATDLVTVLGVLYLLQSNYEGSAEKVAEDLIAAAEGDGIVSWEPDGRADFAAFILEALSLHEVIGVTAKALDVLVQDPHPYSSARIITDFRPVFLDTATGPSPSAGMIIHNLKLVSRTDSDPEHSYFVALDTFDLRELRSIIDRALEKELALRNILDQAGVQCIDRAAFSEEE